MELLHIRISGGGKPTEDFQDVHMPRIPVAGDLIVSGNDDYEDAYAKVKEVVFIFTRGSLDNKSPHVMVFADRDY